MLSPRALAGVGLAAVGIYGLQSIAWPLAPGRDARNYLLYYADMFHAEPVYWQLLLYHTPLAPLFFGTSLDYGGTVATEALAGLLFAVSIAGVAAAASVAGRRVGLLAGAAVALHPGYGALFHQVASDSLFATALAVWSAFAVRTTAGSRARAFAFHGAAMVALYLIRPSGLILLLYGAVVLLLPRAPLRRRFRNAAVFGVAAALGFAAWATVTAVRYDYFGVSRTAGAVLPLYRALSIDHIVEPDNGPASRELARTVEARLLPLEPYSSYGVEVDELFADGGDRVWADLVVLSDRVWGWDSDYAKLRDVGVEAVRAHPAAYARGVAETVGRQLLGPYRWPAPRREGAQGALRVPASAGPRPVPTEGQIIPGSHLWWGYSRPDGAIDQDWSRLDAPRLTFATPELRTRLAEVDARAGSVLGKVPARNGSGGFSDVLNALMKIYPPMVLWLLVGAVGFARRRSEPLLVLGLLAAIGLAAIAFAALSAPAYREYRLPYDPLFVAFGVAGLAALLRREPAGREEPRSR